MNKYIIKFIAQEYTIKVRENELYTPLNKPNTVI